MGKRKKQQPKTKGKIVIKESRTWEGSSGKLPKNNGVPWRGDSGLHDATKAGHALVGGYYDSGHNIKFHFPMSFAMTMLSWSVLEYEPKYRAAGEYEHIIDLIKWGTDYLLLTFDSNLSSIDHIYVQVGESINNNAPNDVYCWMRPEDMNYHRPIQQKSSAPELASEIAAALAAASIVFRDDPFYSRKLLAGAKTVFAFARDKSRRVPYSWNDPNIASIYSSSGYWDEYIWASTWMFLASGDVTYLSLATDSSLAHNAKADVRVVPLRILNWDNKLPGAMLLLTRVRMFLYPGYPYEELMLMYEKNLGLTMCSFLTKFKAFNFTRGGLIDLNNGQGHGLANVVNAIFLASLYEDYLTEFGASGWYCGDQFNPSGLLHEFATSQADYILGNNPLNMSYVVGFGTDFPKHVHHRGASIPHNIAGNYSCTGGWEWRDSPNPNPNVITGAMVGGPNAHDQFEDIRQNSSSTEPTLAGNAGLAAALVSLTSTGGSGMDKNAIFSRIGSLTPNPPPPPPPWIP